MFIEKMRHQMLGILYKHQNCYKINHLRWNVYAGHKGWKLKSIKRKIKQNKSKGPKNWFTTFVKTNQINLLQHNHIYLQIWFLKLKHYAVVCILFFKEVKI